MKKIEVNNYMVLQFLGTLIMAMLLLVAMPFGITDTGFYDMLTY